MFLFGTNLPKRSGLYKRPGTYRARTRPRGALICFAMDGASAGSIWEIYSGNISSFNGSNPTQLSPSAGGQGYRDSVTYFSYATVQPAACSVEAVICFDGNAGSICCLNEGTTGSSTYDRIIYIDGSNRPVFYIFDGAQKKAIGTALIAGKTHHICGTSDGSNIRLYVDGLLEATTATSNGGYTGFTNPCFMVSSVHANPDSTGPFTGNTLFAQFGSVAWTGAEVEARAEAPYGHLFNSQDWLEFALGTGSPIAVSAQQSAVSVITG